MSASNSGDSMEWGRVRSSPGSRRGKKATGAAADKPRQPQRGLGVAQLEKIRLQSEMAEYLHHPPPGGINLEDARSSNSVSSSCPSNSFHANINVSSPYPIHPKILMAYNGGRSGDRRYGESPSTPFIRSPPNYHGAAIYGAPYQPSSSAITLPLFEPEDSVCFRGHYDLNQSVPVDSPSPSMNSDDQQDVDLELKL
ncbi:protein SPEAR1-like [Brachypodium distachyon]|uniref:SPOROCYTELESS-like EAR-containing protein 1 n=1 Tax=Brachypodium distachyon TaxID=15368 RepID=A0A0Q3G037_BRADI|nr:protein SPEAR1-like [Brachypodium distachyon]KQK04927.1 hypothetical protein BRADI_2g16858v3 [Brachypodium distachyon]|eukprot:XP_024315415.1 protein SPEAR1-like [Brachypodium distachyon]